MATEVTGRGTHRGNNNILEVCDLTVQYRGEKKQVIATALDHVNITLPERQTLGVVGESGSGKTTLGMSIMNLIDPPGRIVSGRVEYMGRDVLKMSNKELRKYRWQKVAMIYQSAMNSLNPVRPISHPIAEVMMSHKHVPRREAFDLAIKMLSNVGITPDRAFDYPHELSGGMRQRVVIALAMALSPRVLIADEPTSALDVVTQQHILELIKGEITSKGLSLIFITHEISLLNGLVDNLAVMYAGEVMEHGSFNEILDEPLHPYTEMLLNTLLTLDSSMKEASSIPLQETGLVQNSKSVNMCKYAPRCKYAFDRCWKERPLLLPAGKKADKERLVACHKYN